MVWRRPSRPELGDVGCGGRGCATAGGRLTRWRPSVAGPAQQPLPACGLDASVRSLYVVLSVGAAQKARPLVKVGELRNSEGCGIQKRVWRGLLSQVMGTVDLLGRCPPV